MHEMKDKNLIVLASTYPRWPGDSMRSFIKDYVVQMAGNFKTVRVIVPHYKGAKHRDPQQDNIRTSRFYYAWPTSQENIAYGEFKKTWSYPLKVVLYIASEAWSTLWASVRWRPAIINAHWIIPQGFVAVLLKPVLRYKVVVSVHGADVYTLNGSAMRKIKRFVLSRADAVIVNSTATLAACQELYQRNYQVVPLGVNTSAFTPTKRTPLRTVELLFVGRLTEAKGLHYLLEAMTQLQDVHLTIVGDGDLQADLEVYVRQHGLEESVTMAGGQPHDRLPEYFARADVFVGPSIEAASGWQEAFGLVFAEASAAGVPIVATATGGIKDIVQDGVNGLLVPQRDTSALVTAISKLQLDNDLRYKLGTAGPAIADQFSWENCIEQYLDVFRSVTGA
jgi:glycosyltransferase involved in cell wall biosynthesis